MSSKSTYCIAYEQSLTLLERQLYHLRNPDDIIIGVLEAVCSFYEAEWAGVLDADLEIGIWTPIWWYNENTGALQETRLRAFEFTDGFIRWERALKNGDGVILSDIEAIRSDSPDEYGEYIRLGVRNVMGAPYHKRSMGFLVTKNPKRYADQISFLQAMAYVVASEVGERKLIDGAKMIVPPMMVKSLTEVYICLFSGLEIYTYQGKLDEDRIKSPKICRILVYLLLHKKRAVSARELAEQIWPNDIEGMVSGVRSLIYRFRKTFRLICDEDLIETVEGKYRINPNLTVATDLEILDHLYNQAANEENDHSRIRFLKKAASLYKGGVYPDANNEHWLMPLSVDYQLRFLRIEEELLELLAHKGRYQAVYDETKRALSIEKGNMILYFWMIVSLMKQGTTKSAQQVLYLAERSLTRDDYCELIKKLKEI